MPGSLIRAKVRPGPLAKGVGDTVWSFYAYDYVMTVDDPAAVPIYYPNTNSRAWFVSGYERGASELAGTAVVADERYGDGRVVVFAGEPNFRGFTDGTQKVLWNAVYGADPAAKVRAAASSASKPLARQRGFPGMPSTMVITVRKASTRAGRESARRLRCQGRVRTAQCELAQYRINTGPAEESSVCSSARW